MPPIGLRTTYSRQRRQTRLVPRQQESRSRALTHSGLLFPEKKNCFTPQKGCHLKTKEEPAFSLSQQSQLQNLCGIIPLSFSNNCIASHCTHRSLCVILGAKIMHFFIFKSPLSCRDSNFHFSSLYTGETEIGAAVIPKILTPKMPHHMHHSYGINIA